jgi:hypothetical protein
MQAAAARPVPPAHPRKTRREVLDGTNTKLRDLRLLVPLSLEETVERLAREEKLGDNEFRLDVPALSRAERGLLALPEKRQLTLERILRSAIASRFAQLAKAVADWSAA